MTDIIHASTVKLWLPQATAETMRQGLAREQAEQVAEDSAQTVEAPPCPACGEPVKDRDWERHKAVKHEANEVAQPSGRPDARELLLLAYDAADMERKLTIWRSKHPGIRLEPMGDGTREGGKIIFRRWRIFDGKGRAAK